MVSLVYPCCCCCCCRYFKVAVECLHWAALYSQSIAIEERPVGRLHWSAYSSQRGCVWQLTRFGGRKWRSGVNRISHPDWVTLSVELNLRAKPKYEIFLFSTIYIYIYIYIYRPELKLWEKIFPFMPVG